jgi:hypothetical protein
LLFSKNQLFSSHILPVVSVYFIFLAAYFILSSAWVDGCSDVLGLQSMSWPEVWGATSYFTIIRSFARDAVLMCIVKLSSFLTLGKSEREIKTVCSLYS